MNSMRTPACVLAALVAAGLTVASVIAQPKTPPRPAATQPAATQPAANHSAATRSVATRSAATKAAASRQASTRFNTVPKELVDRWLALKEKRAAAVAFARKVDKEGIDQARKTFNELKGLTRSFNEAIAPYAEASPIRYPSAVPRPGAGEAIYFYKACRAIEKYNAAHKDWTDGGSYVVHKLTNEYREALGLMPLEIDQRLVDAARGHSSWMAQTGEFSHDSNLPGKIKPWDRMKAAGYNYRGAGENITSGPPTGQIAFDEWFKSPDHHHTLVGNFTHLGVACVQDYWTQNFAIGEPVKAGRDR